MTISVFAPADATKLIFWADVASGVGQQRIDRNQGRLMLGNAALFHNNRSGDNATWVPNAAAGANWAPRDSVLAVMHDRGGLAITGMSRTSDGAGISSLSTWGLGGLVIVDAASSFGRAIYGDVQRESGSTGAVGLELAIKNKGAQDTDFTPYAANNGTKGLVITAGGDPSYGGDPVNDCAPAIVIRSGDNAGAAGYKFRRGIVFDRYGISGTDGNSTSNTGVAIQMAQGHTLTWNHPSNATGFYITSSVATAGKDMSIRAFDDMIRFNGTGSVSMMRVLQTASAVNYVTVTGAATGAGPIVASAGSDTDVDLKLSTKGTGVLQFGTHTAIGAETVTGYISIKDAAGNARKIAVVS